jgi:hypothetical protein
MQDLSIAHEREYGTFCAAITYSLCHADTLNLEFV